MDRINGAIGQFRVLVGMDADDELGLEQDQDLSFMDEFNRSCALSHKQRLYGFAACLLLGFFCSILSILMFLHPVKFAVTFTFANLLYLGSTCFLIGPMQQLKMMLDPVRLVATIVYLCSIVLALVSALYGLNKQLLWRVRACWKSSGISTQGCLFKPFKSTQKKCIYGQVLVICVGVVIWALGGGFQFLPILTWRNQVLLHTKKSLQRGQQKHNGNDGVWKRLL